MTLTLLVASVLAAGNPAAFLPKNRPYDAQSYRVETTLSEDGTFKNKLIAKLKITKATGELEFDAYDLKVDFALVDGKPATPSPKYDPETRTGTLTLKAPGLTANKEVTVEISYTGKAGTQHEGFFQVKDAENDKLLPYFFTHFQPHFAQRFFPNNDQPGDKAAFELYAIVDSRYTVLSNGVKTKDEVFQESGKNLRRVEWKQEKPHSTYFTGIAIGQFEPVVINEDLPSTMWVAPGRKDRAWVVVNELKSLWNFQVGYTGTKYGWPKLDIVALPRFFWSGMENTSLIFMRESKVNVEVKNDQLARPVVMKLLSNEMAHQWFGNLVTSKWWDEIWLDEGITTHLGELTYDDANGNEQVEVERTVAIVEDYFRQEDGPRSHALVMKGATAAESSDAVTTRKGASVARMLELWLGQKEFKAGLKAYFEKHSYQSVTTDDFFKAVLEANKKEKDKDLKGFKDSWITKKGYPVIYPEFSFSGSQVTVTIRQQNSNPGEKGPFTFKLPIVIHRENEPQYTVKQTILVDKPEVKVTFDVPAAPQWVNWNEDFGALVRVNKTTVSEEQWIDSCRYDPDPTWRLIAAWNLLGELGNPKMEAEARPTDAALNAILDLLAKDPSPYVREAVMKRLTDSRFKRLPKDFAAIGLKLAKKPENLNDDPLGYIRVRGAALEMLGKTEAPDGHAYILEQLGKREIDINFLGAFAGGAARINTAAALASLKSAIVTQRGRGYPFFRRTAEALGSMEGPEVIASIKELLMQNASNPELTRQLFNRLADNKALRDNPDFAPMIAVLVTDDAFNGDDIREMMLASLDDVKTGVAKEALLDVLKNSKSEQVKSSAKKVLDANFPAAPAPAPVKDAKAPKKK
ncbi:MAG: M1 family aminopeptidase [Myxococcales bacterium]|nr:M1 family aminopeptidase [Myxococcales bacterium]